MPPTNSSNSRPSSFPKQVVSDYWDLDDTNINTNVMNSRNNKNDNVNNNKSKYKTKTKNSSKRKGFGAGAGVGHTRKNSMSFSAVSVSSSVSGAGTGANTDTDTDTDMTNYIRNEMNSADATVQDSTVDIDASVGVGVGGNDIRGNIDANALPDEMFATARKVLPFIVDSASWSGYKEVPVPRPRRRSGSGSVVGFVEMADNVVQRSDSGFCESAAKSPRTEEIASVVKAKEEGKTAADKLHASESEFTEDKPQVEPDDVVKQSANETTENSVVEKTPIGPISGKSNKVYWPNFVAESNSRSYSIPRRKDSVNSTVTEGPHRRSSVGKEADRREETEQDAVDDNEEPPTPSNTAVSSPGRGNPPPMVRTRSLKDVFAERPNFAWEGYSEHLDHPPNDEAVDSRDDSANGATSSNSQNLGQHTTSIRKPNAIYLENSRWTEIDVAEEASDGQSDTTSTDSDKTATPTSTIENRQTDENEEFEYHSDPLREHLLGILEIGQFTDSQIVLKSFNHVFPPIAFRTHKAIIARSPMISCILNNAQDCQGTEVEINVTAGENFTIVKAFEVALQSLYGLPVLNQERLRRETLSAVGHTEKSARMNPSLIKKARFDFVVCYAASGAFFGDYEIVETGTSLAAELVDWDTVELAIHFGLAVDNFLVAYFDHIPVPEQVGEAQAQINVAAIKDLREIWAPSLITSALEFIVNNNSSMDSESMFTLYDKAQTTVMPDRIPYHLRFTPGSVLANPRLATVKFGSFPAHEKPTHENCITSAILISLPFEQLKEMFILMESKQVLTESLARDIIQERETRRLRALEAYAKQKGQALINPNNKGNNDSSNEQKQQQQEQQEQEQEQQKTLLESNINELGYKESVSSKGTLLGTQIPAVSIKVVLEREWTGLG